jgi:two-component system response regulator HydG
VRERPTPSKRGGAYDLAGRALSEVERDLIEANLALVGGNREKAAKVLGIGERTLYRKLKEYGLQ